jgi:hypothetical protein
MSIALFIGRCSTTVTPPDCASMTLGCRSPGTYTVEVADVRTNGASSP